MVCAGFAVIGCPIRCKIHQQSQWILTVLLTVSNNDHSFEFFVVPSLRLSTKASATIAQNAKARADTGLAVTCCPCRCKTQKQSRRKSVIVCASCKLRQHHSAMTTVLMLFKLTVDAQAFKQAQPLRRRILRRLVLVSL